MLVLLIAVDAYVRESHVSAATSPMNCTVSAYHGASGLNASANGDSVVLTWDGDRNQELRLRFVIDNGTRRHFEIPFDATGKKWVRFAAWAG